MSVYRRGSVFWLDFIYRGIRYRETTGQITREAAQAVERQRKDQVRQIAHGVAILEKPLTPRFQDWAEIHYAERAKRIRRPERIEDLTRVALGFWGERPEDPALVYPDAPYHDLRLEDPIRDRTWMLKWETWLELAKRGRPRQDRLAAPARVWSGQTKDQYRSWLSSMYDVALKPAWRPVSGVSENPALGAERDRSGRRTVTLDVDDLRAILGQASWHLRLAMAIALLTPKLRLASILALRFDKHFSPDLRWLRIDDHKTAGETGKPQVAYVPEQLRTILEAAKTRSRAQHVVTYQRQPIAELRGAVRNAVARAAKDRPHLQYGRGEGITFHTLRHSAATKLAELGVGPDLRKGVMGHESLDTTLWYTHLRPTHEIAPAEQLSASLAIADLVLVDRKRPPVGTSVPHVDAKPAKTSGTAQTRATSATRQKQRQAPATKQVRRKRRSA